MPISLNCPKCEHKLSAPESAAGKRVKCPECLAILSVPAGSDFDVVEDDFEVVEDDAPPKKKSKMSLRDEQDDEEPVRPRSKRRSLRDQDEDDFDEDYDDRPSRKKPRSRGSSSGSGAKVAIIIGAVVGAIVLLGIVGAVLGLGGGGKNEKPESVTWTTSSPNSNVVSCQFPGTPNSKDVLSELMSKQPGGQQSLNTLRNTGIQISGQQLDRKGLKYSIGVMEFPKAMWMPAMEQAMLAEFDKDSKVGSVVNGEKFLMYENTTLNGKPARRIKIEVLAEKGHIQLGYLLVANRSMVVVLLDGMNIDFNDPMPKAFFDKITFPPMK